mmetsp:Transcript_58729/g.128557  ORF Transcript_58729/g.128557 Transcript_58729/m.128557 type:complete len:314 (+) Transcript_58729:117-1058(+)
MYILTQAIQLADARAIAAALVLGPVHAPLEVSHLFLHGRLAFLLQVTALLPQKRHVALLELHGSVLDGFLEGLRACSGHSRDPHRSQIPVELLHGQTHRLRQRRHVARLAAQRLPQLLEVLHPFHQKVVWYHVNLVEGDQKWQLGLVQNAAGIQHVGHKRHRLHTSGGIYNIANHRRIRHRQGVADNLPRGRPVEDFDLTRRVDEDVIQFAGAFAEDIQYLIKLRGEEIQRCHDGAVGPQTKMFHDLLVVHGVTNVDIHWVRQIFHRRIQIYGVDFGTGTPQAHHHAMHEGGLTTAGHANHQDHHRRLWDLEF